MGKVVSVENISKFYKLGAIDSSSIKDDLVALFSSKHKIAQRNEQEGFWALNDVSFEVNQGDVLGIIGKNGAGKSTLLKILSKVTVPTKGEIKVKGRIASLLEVGTGFHPDLTGRENVFMNGAILGMNKFEIRSKFDEIVSFSGIEKFIDTPVKRYSSGMYVRLAFAVAAHLEPEILVIDEVLAVGDAEFQKKCLGKMKDVSGEGRTVLFVSHNMAAVSNLCSHILLLKNGKTIETLGKTDAIEKYSDLVQSNEYQNLEIVNEIQIKRIQVLEIPKLNSENLILKFDIFSKFQHKISLDIRLRDAYGIDIAFASLGALNRANLIDLSTGLNQIVICTECNLLANGKYYLSIDTTVPNKMYFERIENCLNFEIHKYYDDKRNVNQEWGYGSFNLPIIKLEQIVI